MKLLKRTVKQAVGSPLGWQLAAGVRRPRLFVLAYHRIGLPDDPFNHVDADVFRRQMQWLQRHCQVLHPANIRGAAPVAGRPAVVLTFDDGYLDYYTLACPVLRHFGFTAANFLSTAFIDNGGLFWWNRVHLSVFRAPATQVKLPWPPHTVFATSTAAERFAFRKACTRYINEAPATDVEGLVQDVFRATGVNVDALPVPRQVMTWDQVRASMDVTCYGGHTHTHVRVPKTQPAAIDAEVRLCRERLERETGIRPTLFAYPTGDTTEHGKQVLREYGFEIAFSLKEETYVPPGVDWLDVPRFPAPTTVPDLAWIALGRAG